ncbi:hypothetical protein B7W85_13205 [Allorhizobium ampelinum]|nr:hypothetical protein B7W85_13205 [Allorhizobium ampelinum]
MNALKDPSKVGSKDLPVHDGDPHIGYYRTKNRDKTFDPVAIFYPDGSNEMVAYRNGREVSPIDIWTWCCRYPVTYEAYNEAVAGNGWADDPKTVIANIAPKDAVIGDNSGDVDEADTLKDQIEAALAGAKAFADITDDEAAAKALSLRNRLNELSGQADKIREKEKKPHLKAGQAIDARWNPLVKSAKAGADEVKSKIAAWETEKLRQRRQEEARIASQITYDADTQSAQSPIRGDTKSPPAISSVDSGKIKAAYGKSASVAVATVVDQVTDWPALAVYMSSHSECQEVLLKLAQRAIDAGRTNVPGITIKEIAKVK